MVTKVNPRTINTKKSSGTAYASGTTFAHGLPEAPTKFGAYIQATSANNGYSIGDRVVLTSQHGDGAAINALYADATNVGFVGSLYNVSNKSTGAGFTPSGANWDIYFWAEL